MLTVAGAGGAGYRIADPLRAPSANPQVVAYQTQGGLVVAGAASPIPIGTPVDVTRNPTGTHHGKIEAMDTRRLLVEAALEVLERKGSAGFSTRAVCAIVNVSAPPLYHHFGSADGLLSAATAEAFDQFLQSKTAAIRSTDPEESLRDGWDDYVRFVAERPRLYAAMMARILHGARIAAADQSFALLAQHIRVIAAAGRLAMPEDDAAQLAWASVNSVALLYVTAALELTEHLCTPDPALIRGIRDRVIRDICTAS